MKHHATPAALWVGSAAALLVASITTALAAGNSGWYTTAQATRGHQLFNNYCAQCHRPDLTGAAGPALIGKTFTSKWGDKPLSDVYTFAHEKMPATNPGSVPPDQMWSIMAYILQKNGYAAGEEQLGDASGTRSLKKG